MSIGGIFSAAKNAASAIYHVIAPKAAPKPVAQKPQAPLPIARGPTPMFPNVGVGYAPPRASPTYNPAGPTYNPTYSSTGSQSVLLPGGQPAAYDALAAQAAARRAVAQAALSAAQTSIAGQLGSAAKRLAGNAGYIAKTPGRYIGAFQAKRTASKNLPGYVKSANQAMDDTMAAWQKKIGDAGKALARGDITPDQYNATVTQARSSIERLAGIFNANIDAQNKLISSPTTGRAGRLLTGAMGVTKKLQVDKVWRYTLGSGDKRIPSVVTAPTRLVNWLHNQGWQPGLNQFGPRPAGKPVSTIYGEGGVQKKATGTWADTFNQRPFNLKPTSNKAVVARGFNTLLDLGLDPANWVTAGGYRAAGKGAKSAASPVGRWLAKLANPAASSFKDTKVGAKAIAGAKWLGAPSSGVGGRYIEGLVKQASKDYNRLNDSEIQAYQDIMKQGNTLDRAQAARWRAQGVDINKVKTFAATRRDLFDRLYQAESGAGIDYSRRFGYFPVQKMYDKEVKAGNIAPEWTPFFARARADKMAKTGFSREQLATGEALRTWAHQRVLGTLPKNRVRRLIGAPNQAWRTSVLALRPAWYAYNAAWNLPASFMAGGRRTAGAYKDILKAMRRDRLPGKRLAARPESMYGGLPEGVTGGLFGETSKALRRPGAWLEDFSRVASYHAATRSGLSEEQALKRVNRYLFDYGHLKNWERPVRAVLPFWQFQKNINRLALQLPFTNPKAARALYYFRRQTVDQPLAQLPNQGYTYTDPQTGEQVSYNPRESEKGKVKLPGLGWTTTPWLPILPEQLQQFGVNPWLGMLNSYVTNKDYFGNPVNDKSLGENTLNLFPQWKLGALGVKALNKGPNQAGGSQSWISSSGYTKFRQGYDPTKPNYTPSLDPSVAFKKVFKNFLGAGVLNASNFDEKKWRQNMNYYQFSKEYFSHNWNKQYPDFNQRTAAQTALAKKYGYDLQKDLFEGKWAKYDSPATAKVKLEKQSANQLQNEVYKVYNTLPKKTGERSKFIQQWKSIMATTDLLDRLPNFNVFKNIPIKAGTEKKPATTAWSAPSKTLNTSSKYASTGRSPSRYASTSGGANPFGYTAGQRKLIAWAYQNLNPDVRRAYLKKIGLYKTLTTAQWDAIKATSGSTKDLRLGTDLAKFPGLGDSWIKNVGDIVSSFAPVSRSKAKPVAFLQTPSRRKTSRRKSLTWKVT